MIDVPALRQAGINFSTAVCSACCGAATCSDTAGACAACTAGACAAGACASGACAACGGCDTCSGKLDTGLVGNLVFGGIFNFFFFYY